MSFGDLFIPLRLLTEYLKLSRSAIFGATFKLVTRVGLMQFFVTLTDGSLEINSLALNNCFSYRNVFQNDANALSKMDLKYPFFFFFCQKAHNFVKFQLYDFAQISLACGTNIC